MNRFSRLLAFVLSGLMIVGTVHAQSNEDRARIAIAYGQSQTPDGGFHGPGGAESSLGATSTAIRILGYVGGSIPDPLGCIDYIKKCQDPDTGGFAQTPGGQPDVSTTASGLMALGELKAADDAVVKRAVEYLDQNAKSYEDVRIAVAGLEAVKAKPLSPDRWVGLVNQGRKGDGTWGEGPSRAFDTGGRTAALLRMGQKPGSEDAIIKALLQGQQPDGGWASKAGPSELSSSYRVMRAFFMLGQHPNLDELRRFIAQHHRDDALYSSAPGKDDAGGTYFALIMLRWARLLEGEPPLIEKAGFSPLITSDLRGWDGETELWSVRDGVLTGQSNGLDHNTFLAAPGIYRDFALQLLFRLKDGQGNTGVQLRSVRVPPHEMSGYQADIGEGYWGSLYDESRRNRVLVDASPRARETLHKDGWNHYGIRAFGPHISLSLNGVGSVDYREADANIAPEGQIAVQMHAGGPMQVEFKDIWIQPVPSPVTGQKNTPGFHLKTIDIGGETRRYTLYLPEGYDGQKKFPVVLFLHGAGERGDDGIVCSQVGLGPAIVASPKDCPFIGVFPQARRTWQAGSPDADAALATLDEVMKTYACDPQRVVLTGLSMGGAGSWSNGAAHPDRFSAIVPVCGFGDEATALKLKGKPVWTLLGDADMDRIVHGTRAMVRALRDAGPTVRHTEYRSVGHNSWDRAYNTPALITWMLEQKR